MGISPGMLARFFVFFLLITLILMFTRKRALIRHSAEQGEIDEWKCLLLELLKDDLPGGIHYENDWVDLDRAELINDSTDLLVRCNSGQINIVRQIGLPIRLGFYREKGWSGGLPFYLFACPNLDCGSVQVDYKHGHNPYLSCAECKQNIPFSEFVELAQKKGKFSFLSPD